MTDRDQFEAEGFAVVEGLFSRDECAELVEYMGDLHAGRRSLDGFEPREPQDWERSFNQHWYDDITHQWLIDSRLRDPLRTCLGDDPEGIQTMYFWRGSEQRRHQDQYYLPACISAWIPLQDVDESNGTILVQPGSHRRRLIVMPDLEKEGDFEGWDYNDAVDDLFESNALPEKSVDVSAGDVVIFHGVLVHRGGPIGDVSSTRHVLANHYIPYGFDGWNHSWDRFSFDGGRRYHPEIADL